MKILVVDCYEEGKKGRRGYNSFHRTLVASLNESGPLTSDVEIVHRNLRDVGDHTLEWETEKLDEEARRRCGLFDSIDIVCIGGDMQICPWHPLYMKVVTLIFMCDFLHKPLLGVGSGAYAGVYSIATRGARFHMLNEPYGEPYEKLGAFPRYSIGTRAFASGWLNNETGDVYTFHEANKLWKPVCNIGMFRISSTGRPTAPGPGMSRPKHLSKDDHSLTREQDPEAIYFDEREISVHIRNAFIQNRFFHGLQSQNFVACEVPNWYINGDGALPTNHGIYIMAESSKGPIILGKGDCQLFLACEINQGKSYPTMKAVMGNFIREVIQQVRDTGKIGRNLTHFLFGDITGRNPEYDSSFDQRGSMAPTLAATAVASTLPHGPVRVDMPVFNMFFIEHKDDTEFAKSVESNRRRASTVGKQTKKELRHPIMARRKRLEDLFRKTGNPQMLDLGDAVLQMEKEEDPYGYNEAQPASMIDMIQGQVGNMLHMSSVASDRRKARIIFREDSARNQRNEDEAKKANLRAHQFDQVHMSDSLTNTPVDMMSLADENQDELVNEGGIIRRRVKGHKQRPFSAAQSRFIPEVAGKLTIGASDWKKLEAKMTDDEDEKSRLYQDKTRVVDWAMKKGKISTRPTTAPSQKGTGSVSQVAVLNEPGKGGVEVRQIEAAYKKERKEKLFYEPPESPNRMKRDTELMYRFKQAQQGIVDRVTPVQEPPALLQAMNKNSSAAVRPKTTGGKQRGHGDHADVHSTSVSGYPFHGRNAHSAGAVPNQPKKVNALPRPKTSSSAVRLNSGAKKPFNNMKKYKEWKYADDKAPYEGAYDDIYRTPYEQEAAYIRQNKSRWSGGHFRTAFGPSAGIKPIPSANIAGDGKYPDKVKDGTAENVAAADWLLVRKVNKEKQIGPAWRTGHGNLAEKKDKERPKTRIPT